MKLASPFPKKRARLEIIPLIDIIFFLLATFALLSLSMIQNQGITVNLPRATSAESSDFKKGDTVTITLTKSGQLMVNKSTIKPSQLADQLLTFKTSNPKLKVIIQADSDAAFGKAVQVLDEVRKLNLVSVILRTNHDQK